MTANKRSGRPMGEVSRALVSAAQRGPGTVRQLAERACVGFDAARYKVKDLVRSGALQVLSEDRPMVLTLPMSQRNTTGLDGLFAVFRACAEREAEDGDG